MRGRLFRGLLVAGLAMFSVTGSATAASAATYSNSTNINILDSAAASPYPSQIAVSGLAGEIDDVTVKLEFFHHTWPDDVDVMLVGPGGQTVVLMSDAGGSTDVPLVPLTFDDDASQFLPDETQLLEGTYRPTDYDPFDRICGCTEADHYPAPAPPEPETNPGLSVYDGTDPNGTWSLYVVDDQEGDAGTMFNGWSITISTIVQPPPAPTLLSPADGSIATTGTPFFDWTDVPVNGPVRYAIQADDNGCGFDSPEIDIDGLTQSQFTPGSALPEGPSCWRVRAEQPHDEQLIVGAWSEAWTVIVDTLPPEVSLNTNCSLPGSIGWCRAPSYTYEMSAFDVGSGLIAGDPRCEVDGTAAPCVGTVATEGPHMLRVTAQDQAGRQTTRSVALGVDSRPPDALARASCSLPGNDGWCRSSVGVTATANDPSPGSGFVAGSPRCTYDTEPISCGNFTETAQGGHTLEVSAADRAGWGDLAAAFFKIDSIAPETLIDSTPPAATQQKSASFSFSASEASTFTCKLDSGAEQSCSSPKSYAALPEGSHTFCVRATDLPGNPDSSPACFTWKVDVTAPETVIVSGPPNPSNSTAATFHFAASESPVTFACSVNGSSFAPCTNPATYTGLPEGENSFRVRATDQAGNIDPTAPVYSWVIDVTPPDTAILTGPESPTTERHPSFTFISDEFATFQCSLDGGPYTFCSSPKSYFNLGEGHHTFRARAVDKAGNIDPTPDLHSWTIDLSGPVIEIIRPTPGWWWNNQQIFTGGSTTVVIGPVVVEARATDPLTGICALRFWVDGVQVPVDEVSYDAARSVWSFTYRPTAGSHEIEAAALNCARLRSSDEITVLS